MLLSNLHTRDRWGLGGIVAVILLFAGWSLVLYIIGPQKIIQTIGVGNSYLVGFAMGVLGGSSIFTSSAFYATIFSLVIGGLNLYILAIVGGIGLSIGDSLFYLLGHQGKQLTTGKVTNRIDRFSKWVMSRPTWEVIGLTFIYAALTPFPNDLLMLSIGLTHYPYKKVIWGILAGNIFFLILIGLLAQYGMLRFL